MRYLFLLPLVMAVVQLSGQSIGSYVITSAGESIMSEDGAIYLSVGEPLNTEISEGDIMVSQGFLQVTIQGAIVDDEDLEIESFTVYPNPTMDQIQVEVQGDTRLYRYRVYDAAGRSVTKASELGSGVIDMHGRDDGIYFLILFKEDNSSRSIKIVKQ